MKKNNLKNTEVTKRNNLKSNRGITLVALVVTIVVLLILAGVSINMVLGNNGLITKAKNAKTKTEQDALNTDKAINSLVDEMEAILGNGGNRGNEDSSTNTETGGGDSQEPEDPEEDPTPTIEVSDIKVVSNSDGSGDSLTEASTNAGETLYITFIHSTQGGSTYVEPSLPFAVTENGTYSFIVSTLVNDEEYTEDITVTVNQFKTLMASIAIGDLANYTYDTVAEGYSLPRTQSGYNDQTVTQSTTTLQWKVLNIDEENGTIDLVSSEPTSNEVYFKGALGYNNGVYLLNDMCAHLYSNSSRGITARSINLVDMERHLTTGENGGIAARNAYMRYGSTYKYETNRHYPKLYAHEIGQGIGVTDGTTITQPTLDGSVLDPYNESNKYYTAPTTETYTQADTALTVTHTYYSIPINEANYGPAAAVLSNSNYYWVASRYVNAYFSSYAYFGLRRADPNTLGDDMFYSNSASNDYGYRLRPVVSIASSLLDGTKDASGAWNLVA